MWEKKSIIIFIQTSQFHNLYQLDIKKHLYSQNIEGEKRTKRPLQLPWIHKSINTTNFWLHLVHWHYCGNWVLSFAVHSQMTVRRPFKFIYHHNTPSLKPLRQHFGTGKCFLQRFFQHWCPAVPSPGSPVRLLRAASAGDPLVPSSCFPAGKWQGQGMAPNGTFLMVLSPTISKKHQITKTHLLWPCHHTIFFLWSKGEWAEGNIFICNTQMISQYVFQECSFFICRKLLVN